MTGPDRSQEATKPTPDRIELLGIELLEEHARRLAAASRSRGGRATAAARTCGSSTTAARCRRPTARWPTTPRGEPAVARRPSGCSTTSTSSSAAARDIVARPAAVVLPPAADASPPTSSPASPRIYALALELIRSSAGHLDAQRLLALHHRVPVGHAADDRRAVGVAERAQAGARRAPARARRRARDDARASPARRSPGARALERTAPRRPSWPDQVHPAFVTRLLQRFAGVRRAPPRRCSGS